MSTRTKVAVSLVVYLMVVFHAPQQGANINTNERVRFYLAHALLERGEVTIDEEIARFGPTHDKSKREDHFYSDKPPMQSLLSVAVLAPFYWASDGTLSAYAGVLIIRLLLHGLCGLICFWLMFVYLQELFGEPHTAALVAAIGMLGTPLSTFFATSFSHAISATMLLTFFLVVHRAGRTLGPGGALLLGLLGGAAVLTEFLLTVPLVFFSAALLLRLERKLNYLTFLAGGLVMAALLAAYNQAAFGAPLSLGYEHLAVEDYAEGYQAGFFGFSTPHKEALWALTFSLRIGTFTLSPFLLFMLPGVVYAAAARRWLELLLALVVLVYLLLLSSFTHWHAGVSFGARYLVPVYPFMILLSARGLWGLRAALGRAAGWAYVTLGLSGVLLFAAVNATDPFAPEVLENPIANFTLVYVREQLWATGSILSAMGLPGGVSFVLWCLLSAGVVLWLAARALRGANRIPALLLSCALSCALLTLSLSPDRDRWDDLRATHIRMCALQLSDEAFLRDHVFRRRYHTVVRWILDAQGRAELADPEP